MNTESSWKARCLSIVELFQGIEWRGSTREIYQSIALELIAIVPCDSVSIRLLALTGDTMVGYVCAGEMGVLSKECFPTLPISVGRMSNIFEKLEPVVYAFDAPDEKDLKSEDGSQRGYSHAVVVPLVADNTPIGAVEFIFKEGQFYDSTEQVCFLTELCKILGSVLNAMDIVKKTAELKISEETQRIGSELHDNFAQPLSVIALEADKAIISKEDGDDIQLSESLERISDLSRQSFGMMADEVAMLHSASEISEDLMLDINHYIENFKKQWGIDIRLHSPDEKVSVSRSVGNQALRILHEALSNVLRHSHSEHVIVTVACGRGAIELTIEDDGCGFNVKDASTRQLGIKIMDERAKSVGGRLTVVSVVGEGTSIIADFPLIA